MGKANVHLGPSTILKEVHSEGGFWLATPAQFDGQTLAGNGLHPAIVIAGPIGQLDPAHESMPHDPPPYSGELITRISVASVKLSTGETPAPTTKQSFVWQKPVNPAITDGWASGPTVNVTAASLPGSAATLNFSPGEYPSGAQYKSDGTAAGASSDYYFNFEESVQLVGGASVEPPPLLYQTKLHGWVGLGSGRTVTAQMRSIVGSHVRKEATLTGGVPTYTSFQYWAHESGSFGTIAILGTNGLGVTLPQQDIGGKTYSFTARAVGVELGAGAVPPALLLFEAKRVPTPEPPA